MPRYAPACSLERHLIEGGERLESSVLNRCVIRTALPKHKIDRNERYRLRDSSKLQRF